MKRVLAFAMLLALLMFGLTACGSQETTVPSGEVNEGVAGAADGAVDDVTGPVDDAAEGMTGAVDEGFEESMPEG